MQRAASFRGSIQTWIRWSPFLPDKYEINKGPELKKDLLTKPGNRGHANKPHATCMRRGHCRARPVALVKQIAPNFFSSDRLLPPCPWCCSQCAEECELLLLLGLTLTPIHLHPWPSCRKPPAGLGAVGRGAAGPAAPSASAQPLRSLKQEPQMEGSPGLLPPLLFFTLSSSSSLPLLPEAQPGPVGVRVNARQAPVQAHVSYTRPSLQQSIPRRLFSTSSKFQLEDFCRKNVWVCFITAFNHNLWHRFLSP